MAKYTLNYDVELNNPVVVQQMPTVFYQGDALNADIVATVTEGGEAASLSGTATAYFVRSDGTSVAEAGTISGNVITVTIPGTALEILGGLTIQLKLDDGNDTVTTLLYLVTTVIKTTSGQTVDGDGAAVMDIQALFHQLELLLSDPDYPVSRCEAAALAANSAATAANAAAEAANAAAQSISDLAPSKLTVDGNVYTLRVDTDGAAGYITLVEETE